MNTLKTLFAGAVLSALSSAVLAAGNPLSVHVLNLQDAGRSAFTWRECDPGKAGR